MKYSLLTLAIFSNLFTLCLAQTAPLLDYTADYQAQANGLSATATRSLTTLAPNLYRLSNVLEASLAGRALANLEQSSEFRLEGNSLQAQSYAYSLSGVSRASHAIAFNWDANVAISSEDEDSWRLPLEEGVMDQLSYQAALRREIIVNGTEPRRFTFSIIDRDEIVTHEYSILGLEPLSTPLGELDAVRLERTREAGDDRRTEIWLAVNWNFILARLEQVNRSGLHIVLELESAELNGEEVRPAD